jgi:pimeloyl-ACP methyl ester carboxylesterase
MGRLIFLCILTALAVSPAAAEPRCNAVRPEPGAGYIVPGSETYLYQTLDDGRSLALDLFVQPDAGVHPTVLVIHGGGWTTGSRDAHIGQFLELLTEAGYNWASLDYRVGDGGREAAADDVRAALAFLRCQAQALRLDMTKAVALGEDVGGDLAMSMLSEGRVTGAVLVGAVYRDALPLTRAVVRLVHGGEDREVPVASARQFCDRLNAQDDLAGGVCELDVVEGAIHRAENWRPSQWGYKPRLVEWLRRVVGPGAARPVTFEPQPVRDVLKPGLHKRLIYNHQTGQTLDAWIPGGPAHTSRCSWCTAAGGKPEIASLTSRRFFVRSPAPAWPGSRWTTG